MTLRRLSLAATCLIGLGLMGSGLALPAAAQAPAAQPATPAQPTTPAQPAQGATPAQPRQPSAAQQAQQQRMKDCNAGAAERKLAGDARKNFMSQCLSGKVAPHAAPAAGTPAAAASGGAARPAGQR
jgi:hypothetical protein